MKGVGLVGLLFLIVGLVAIAAAIVVKFVLLPSQAQWPEDVDSTRTYDGTLQVMLNPRALQDRDTDNLFVRDVPITNQRHVTTEEVKGQKAVVLEVATMIGPRGNELARTEKWYAIDRKTMNHLSMDAVSDLDNKDKIGQREGLVIGFPIGTEKRAYEGWSDDYQKTVTVNYVREEKHAASGLNTYVFESQSGPQEILDPNLLANLPSALPKAMLVGLAQNMDLPVPQEMKRPLGLVLQNLPDPVPLKYTYQYKTTYWVEPTTGVLIDYEKSEARQVALPKEVLAQAAGGVELPQEAQAKLTQLLTALPDPISLMPVFAQQYKMSDASIQDAAQDARDAKSQLDLFGTTVPLAAGIGGLVLALLGLALLGLVLLL